MKGSMTKTSGVRRILVPVDFSDASRHAAAVAFGLARQLGAGVRCVAVIDVADLRIAMRAGLHDFETNRELQADVHRWIADQFDTITAECGLDVEREVRRGIPEQEILDSVRQYEPDLIVMGSSGITRRLPLGSRTRTVMRATEVPVLVVRAPEKSSKASVEAGSATATIAHRFSPAIDPLDFHWLGSPAPARPFRAPASPRRVT
jgi:Universal stress protein UspA and related nucleotide-binding proteins